MSGDMADWVNDDTPPDDTPTAEIDGHQGSFFDPPDMTDWAPERVSRYEEMHAAWLDFKYANPEVYVELRTIALALVARGCRRYGIGGLFEVLRWKRAMTTSGGKFKLNNNFRAFYARELMRREPQLADFFELREQISGRGTA